ncbi:MAG: sigma-70 family RNA polymerase sigma factor [Candidatus Eremiobacteraeota bacterium]|nr:sigma-70 family RNA polymerase sigma factor [Candidatus Eremiobacteraeota bacterium]
MSNSPNLDSDLIQRMFARDSDAFATLYDRYKSLVFGIAKRVVKSQSIAEDITQSVFLKVWTGQRIIQSQYFVAWLTLVTRNTALDWVRSKWFKETQLEDEIAHFIVSKTDVAAEAVDGSQYADVRDAVATLPEGQREAIEMAYFGGLSYAEVAAQLELPPGTVKSRIRAGLLRLYRTMSKGSPSRQAPAMSPKAAESTKGPSDMKMIAPDNETQRMAAVRRYDILDTPPDGAFDHVTRIAARLFNVPISIVSIVDTNRIWFKSRYGIGVEQVTRDPGLCASAILHNEPWIVNDAAIDPRTLANPLVSGELGLRFYAGAPLTTSDGYNLGTLCVIDKKARVFSEAEANTLRDLAAIVVDELELRLSARAKFRMEKELRDTLSDYKASAETLIQTFQTSLLPTRMPQIAGVEIASLYNPAGSGHVGGDFYDIFPLDKDRWGIAIGDICGKGPQAAARTALARYTIRTAAMYERSPSGVLATLNEAMLTGAEKPADFCTACFAILESKDGQGCRTMTVASGGHPLPIAVTPLQAPDNVGLAGDMLGAFAKPSFSNHIRLLSKGDAIVFYTDGVTEARVADGFFGTERLTEIIQRSSHRGAAAILKDIQQALAEKQVRQQDDVALLAFRVAN